MRNPENYFYIQQSKKAVKITLGVNKSEISYTQYLETIYESSEEEDSYKLLLEQARLRDNKRKRKRTE